MRSHARHARTLSLVQGALSPRVSAESCARPYRDTRSNDLCCDREFFMSRHRTLRSLSRQRILFRDRTHLSSMLVRARRATLSRPNFYVATQVLPALTTSCCDTVHAGDTEPKGLCRDKLLKMCSSPLVLLHLQFFPFFPSFLKHPKIQYKLAFLLQGPGKLEKLATMYLSCQACLITTLCSLHNT